jgi:hypothetical protein
MHLMSKMLGVIVGLALMTAASTPARSQINQALMSEVALKSGESVELGDLLWTVNCRTYLKGLPQVEILDGPPAVTVAVKEKMILPRFKQCAKRVPGGTLSLTAGDITDESYTTLRLRIKYNTLEGPRDRSVSLRVALIPQ